jgi:dihydrodipicolinate synthase/N-acetylneuraminate lyase
VDPLHGAIAAAVTPLTAGGGALDASAIPGLAVFLAEGGIDGVLVCGTTGEGVLLSAQERRRVTEGFVAARPAPGFQVAVHAGAQTTAETCALATHARDAGADAVAVIAPPYFALDGESLTHHLLGAAHACDPVPFYIYEFAARSGYPTSIAVVERVRADAPNLAGLKVSDTPFDAVRPYLGLGLDVLIGSEPLVREGMALGAVGAVSGLATAFPGMIAAFVRDPSEDAHAGVADLRSTMDGLPFQAALKEILVKRGVIGRADVRAPLRGLTANERERVRAAFERHG